VPLRDDCGASFPQAALPNLFLLSLPLSAAAAPLAGALLARPPRLFERLAAAAEARGAARRSRARTSPSRGPPGASSGGGGGGPRMSSRGAALASGLGALALAQAASFLLLLLSSPSPPLSPLSPGLEHGSSSSSSSSSLFLPARGFYFIWHTTANVAANSALWARAAQCLGGRATAGAVGALGAAATLGQLAGAGAAAAWASLVLQRRGAPSSSSSSFSSSSSALPSAAALAAPAAASALLMLLSSLEAARMTPSSSGTADDFEHGGRGSGGVEGGACGLLLSPSAASVAAAALAERNRRRRDARRRTGEGAAGAREEEEPSTPSPLRRRSGPDGKATAAAGIGASLRSSLLHRAREGVAAAAADSRVRSLAFAMATTSALSSWGYLLRSSAVAAAASSASPASASASGRRHSAASSSSSSAHRQAAFAKISVASAVATAVLQAGATRAALDALGPVVALSAQPVAASLGLVFVAIAAGASDSPRSLVGAVGAAEVLRKAAAYVLSRPAREALFARLPPALLYESKLLLDALAPRAGDAAAALWSKALTSLAAALKKGGGVDDVVALSPRAAALAGLPLAAMAAVAAVAAGRVAFGGSYGDYGEDGDGYCDEEEEAGSGDDDGVP